jgi:gamma-glutamyltranspeptidase/glutathione hydrolase
VPATSRRLAIVGGTPGAHRQPTTNLQVLDAIVNARADPQDALDRPRWSLSPHGVDAVEVEVRDGSPLGEAFRDAGLRVVEEPGWHGKFGRASVATVTPAGVAIGSDLRGEGVALTY